MRCVCGRRRLGISSSESARRSARTEPRARDRPVRAPIHPSSFLLVPEVPKAAARGPRRRPAGFQTVSDPAKDAPGRPFRHGHSRIPNPRLKRQPSYARKARRRTRDGSIAAPVTVRSSHRRPRDKIGLRRLNQTAHEQNVDQPEHRRHPGNEVEHDSAPAGSVPAPRRARTGPHCSVTTGAGRPSSPASANLGAIIGVTGPPA